jgi:signal transduction histidine kinase
LLYGRRDEPYAVLSHLGRRLEATLAPSAVLETIVQTVAQALRLPYAALTLQQGDNPVLAAAYGHPASECVRWPLVYQSEAVGELLLAPRGPGETFSSADTCLLDDLARQAGVAAHAVQLTAELQASLRDLRHSRERLVVAQEEERRRVQRDLHDGLGPTLASIHMRLGSCLELASAIPAEALVRELETVDELVRQATADIRRLVHDLRPPALEQLGLVPALRQNVGRFARETGIATDVQLQLDRSLPAAAEVALFRVVQEALVNISKHASAQHVAVRLEELDDWIELTVADDGVGMPTGNNAAAHGAGLRGMRDRADLLGGQFDIASPPGGGTHLRLRIPLMLEDHHDA